MRGLLRHDDELIKNAAEEFEQLRPLSTPVNRFQFGRQTISTRVHMMMPAAATPRPQAYVDVTAAMSEQPRARAITLTAVDGSDPFAGIEVS